VKRLYLVLAAIGIAIVAVVGVRAYPAFTTGDGTLHEKLHWAIYGFDRVTYHGRPYGYPREVSRTSLESQYGKLHATGESVRGLQVLASPKSKQDIMTLILEKNDHTCIVYDKFGGP
jgi:hypothetical protein